METPVLSNAGPPNWPRPTTEEKRENKGFKKRVGVYVSVSVSVSVSASVSVSVSVSVGEYSEVSNINSSRSVLLTKATIPPSI